MFDTIHKIFVYPDISRLGNIGPFFDEITLVVEDLDSVILTVTYYDSSVLVDPNVMKKSKFAGTSSLFAPRQK